MELQRDLRNGYEDLRTRGSAEDEEPAAPIAEEAEAATITYSDTIEGLDQPKKRARYCKE